MNSGNAPRSTAAVEVSLDTSRLESGSELSGANRLQRTEQNPAGAAARLPSSASHRVAHKSRYRRTPLWNAPIRAADVPATTPSTPLRCAEINPASRTQLTSSRSRLGSGRPQGGCALKSAHAAAVDCAPHERFASSIDSIAAHRSSRRRDPMHTEHVDCNAESETISCTD